MFLLVNRVISYECCPGYEKLSGEKGCPAGKKKYANQVIAQSLTIRIMQQLVINLGELFLDKRPVKQNMASHFGCEIYIRQVNILISYIPSYDI